MKGVAEMYEFTGIQSLCTVHVFIDTRALLRADSIVHP